MRESIQTLDAPAAIGAYSQAIRTGNTLYLSGQIPLDPKTQQVVSGDISNQITQVFDNIKKVIEAAGSSLDHVVKLTVYLVDLSHIIILNDIMAKYFKQPYPARTTIQIVALPKQVDVEVEAVVVF